VPQSTETIPDDVVMTDRQIVDWIVVSDRKHDRGGSTHFGVTLRLFSAYMGREMTVDQLKALTKAQAIDILFDEFCFKPKLHAIHDARVKLCAVDYAIHSGPAHAIKSLQWALQFSVADTDGEFGAQTQAALNAADPADIHRRMLAYRLRFLARLVSKDPTQADHIGWWNRIANLMELSAL